MDIVATSLRADTQDRAAETPWAVLDRCARALRAAYGNDRPAESPRAEGSTRADMEARAWLADHLVYLRTLIRDTRAMLSRRYYAALPRTDRAIGEPDIRHAARRLVALTGPSVDQDAVTAHFEQAQRTRHLTLAELWAIAPMLRLALFERLDAALAGDEHLVASATADAIREVVGGLRALDDLPWRELTESLSALDAMLRLDPAGVYATMDFETRDAYRRAVERIARRSPATEEEVGRVALDLAGAADGGREGHVGWYLVGPGRPLLEQRTGFRKKAHEGLHTAILRWPALFHLGGAWLLTSLLLAGVARWLYPAPWWLLALLAVPASQAGIAIVNAIAHMVVGPRRLPRLDFSAGVPDDCRTLVVVPALLFSPSTIAALLERLEVHFLSERDPNMLFALLTDCTDSREEMSEDEELGRGCADAVARLNRRYGASGSPFYLFHRARSWNASEGVWMGHERKRGKLNALNAWLLGGPDPFSIKVGDLQALAGIRYVITLDADTRMPIDAARTLVATAAHPLNAPVFDPRRNIVVDGYAILQPRVSISAESASRSRLARLRGGPAGIDPYATAVSDVYHDLYGQASFTGKGLYDLRAFHRALDGRFPDAALLSHDLIEGEHCRVGLVTDIEFVDDYPGSYGVYSKRKHRWARGDWQLLYWLLPRVPNAAWTWARNPLAFISRWKIFDNLRRSAADVLLAAALVCAWFFTPDRSTLIVGAVAALVLAPAYAEFVLAAFRLPPRRFLASFGREKARDLARAHGEALVSFALALHQAALMTDAIGRTLVRRLVTHRRLLEWETTAQAESAGGRRLTLAALSLGLTAGASAVLLLLAIARHLQLPATLLGLLWLAAPLVVAWLNGHAPHALPWKAADVTFVRGVALRTWRYFTEWGAHGLVPDNIQETPVRVAHQASPTNIGLQLASTLAAHDFGFITLREFAATCTRLVGTIERLDRYRGHFYNWYDTRTLQPLAPRYVSTVDSGNLCAALLTTKQGCEELRHRPILDGDIVAGLRDHCIRLRNALPRRLRRRAVGRAVSDVLRRLHEAPSDAFAWSRLLSEVRVPAIAVHEWLRVSDRRVAEARDWAAQLVERIDAVAREIRRYAPWVDAVEPLRLPARALHVLGRVPTPAAGDAHYDAVEDEMRAARVDPACWRLASRVLLQTARARIEAREADGALRDLGRRCDRIVNETDFAFLFDRRRKLLHIGFSVESSMLDPAYYDLLASEARTAVLLAIAKRDIPPEAWFHLGRKLISLGPERVLVSWGGTMFEHLMPVLFMKTYERSLLASSMRAMARIQQAQGRARGIPWGFSEAAHSARDGDGRYQYRTFGVPQVAMRRTTGDDLVVAPYATMLALMTTPIRAVQNLRRMASNGWIGRYGFYESVDYSGADARPRGGTVVRAFMAHHQGMSLLALSNAVLSGRMQSRFHADPLVAAAERLLQERIPAVLPADEFGFDLAAALAPWSGLRAAQRDGARLRWRPRTPTAARRTVRRAPEERARARLQA